MSLFTDYINQIHMHEFLTGATFILGLVAALLFLRFYRKTRDRLFLFFSAALAIMGLNRLMMVLVHASDESLAFFYLVRLLAFVLIFYAIIDKNRRPAKHKPNALSTLAK